MTVKLYQFPSAWGLPNPSPFCMKLEVFLRLAEIPYEVVTWPDPRKAPKGKLPFIEHDGNRIADSHFCLLYLAETFEVSLDDHLSAGQKAHGFALCRMLDEYFYWMGVYNRWIDDRVWPQVKAQFFAPLPPVVRDLVAAMLRGKVRKALKLQGLGRHSQKEIYFLAEECLEVLVDLLGDNTFVFGALPSYYDATLYSYVANALLVPFDTELQRAKDGVPGLVAYCERMKARCFGEA